MAPKLNVVPFVSVDHMMKLVLEIGVERFLVELAEFIEEDFRRWETFDKKARIASRPSRVPGLGEPTPNISFASELNNSAHSMARPWSTR